MIQAQQLANQKVLDDMNTSNLFGISQFTTKKTNKRMLNMNAIKFKLTKLRSTQIRYEVIYKNLVRDLRKFYQ